MAKKQKRQFSRKLKATANLFKKIDKDGLKVIAEQSLAVAKQTLADGVSEPNFTQKYGDILIEEIGLENDNPQTYRIFAPITNTREMKLQMYFAEYGAGVDAMRGGNIPSSGYTPHAPKYENGKWEYYTLMGEKRLTNTSIPVGYMREARRFAKDNLVEQIAKIKTQIKRIW